MTPLNFFLPIKVYFFKQTCPTKNPLQEKRAALTALGVSKQFPKSLLLPMSIVSGESGESIT